VRIAAVVLAGVLAGCNVIQIQQASIVRSMQGAGLEMAEVELGEDHVRYFHREGEGTPVLLVHGFGGSALWQWHYLATALEGRTVVMPDLLWFGGSYSPSTDHSLDHQVSTMARLLEHLGYERVDVVGVSYGGLIAYELAASQPELVRRMVLVDSPGREYTRRDYEQLCARFGVEHIGDMLIPDDEHDVRVLLDIAYAEPPPVPDFALLQVQGTLYGGHREDQRALLDALLRDIDALRARPDPSAEALLVWGRDDPIFPMSIARRLAGRLGARLMVIENARHAPNVERYTTFNEIVVPFLAEP
jgi:pimeloyl-ACP methyl ester carboxylesterase